MIVLLDNGHGFDTPGKCSPDNKLREYKYTRQVVKALEQKLQEAKIQVIRIVPELTDIPLNTRVRRVNEYCKKYGTHNCCLISIHCNACGKGTAWYKARGWSAYTSKGNTKGDILANHLYKSAEQILLNGTYVKTFTDPNKIIRSDKSDGDMDIEENFTILNKTNCAAVLTENMFQDNISDVQYLLSEIGLSEIVTLHYEGILSYINSFKN